MTKVTLKNIKHMPSLSEETNCFSATVYIDGKKAGEVSNRGHGGCDDYYPRDLGKRLDEIAKEWPPYECPYEPGKMVPHNAETMIGELFEAWFEEREERRLDKQRRKWCKDGTVYRAADRTYKEGEWTIIKKPFNTSTAMYLRMKHGQATEILNERFSQNNDKKSANVCAPKR